MKAVTEANIKIKKIIFLGVEYIENDHVEMLKKWPLGRLQSVDCSVMFTSWNKL
jgi:hypothetical protein